MEVEKKVGQTKNAGFQIGVRKTFSVSIDVVWDFLFTKQGLDIWLGHLDQDNPDFTKVYLTHEGVQGKITVFKPQSHIRLTWKPENWTNTSILQVRLINTKGKTTVSFHQEKLANNNQREEMKAHWERVIEQIKKELSLL